MSAHPPKDLIEWPDWLRPGEVFAVDGSIEKIIHLTLTEIQVVTSYDGFGSWLLRSFLTALREGRITRPAIINRFKRKPGRPYSNAFKRGALPDLVAQLGPLPSISQTGPDVITTAIHTLNALRSGAPAQPLDLVLVQYLAHAGATAEGLGPAVAFRSGRLGRYPILQREAQDAQALLQRLSEWLAGGDELYMIEIRTIQHFVERGLEAFGFGAPPPVRKRGRPVDPDGSGRAVQRTISRRWRDHCRGIFSLSQAIRMEAEATVLLAKQVDLAWEGRDHTVITLEQADEEAVAMEFHRIEISYHRLPDLTPMDVAVHRREAATLLRALRQRKRDLCEYPAGRL